MLGFVDFRAHPPTVADLRAGRFVIERIFLPTAAANRFPLLQALRASIYPKAKNILLSVDNAFLPMLGLVPIYRQQFFGFRKFSPLTKFSAENFQKL